ncbi:hypothetical protein KIH86_21580 [Paenibacillus sp. HN-1]|uniref:hypothetical protein n=1 Tax=Paenibacillus TaxID=44249 RepID=UPI001CA9B96D|nr:MULTISPECIES: hypothetical protein [Paenibacillus]MBY9080101.1 hypothetical protein [Paenibacillus sp. CGMCC 1.18879]MBY9086799.1 hypothetical protein [Paenibacillus sinensis]
MPHINIRIPSYTNPPDEGDVPRQRRFPALFLASGWTGRAVPSRASGSGGEFHRRRGRRLCGEPVVSTLSAKDSER